MTTSPVPKKDVQKLQRAIVDGLEDVKGQDIRVFDTESLSPLFERVIVASGTSNRQTKALAASVCDAVRAAGFAKPRVEGESNGEWVIVDCGPVVAHIFQPNFRTYYNLEELWGEKPVRLKLGVAKPQAPATSKAKAASTTAVAAKPASSLRRSSAAKKGVQEAFPSKAQEARARAAKSPIAKALTTKSPTTKTPAVKTAKALKTLVVGAPAKKRASPAAAKPAAKTVKPAAKAAKPAAKKTTARKVSKSSTAAKS